MTPLAIFIWGMIAGFILLSFAVEMKRRIHPQGLIGATFVGFRADGCMASDHKFLWTGVGDHFEEAHQKTYGPLIAIRIVKREGDPTDSRDEEKGFEKFFASDSTIQEVAPNLFLVIR